MPQGVTEYFGLTKGTVPQTLITLERKGLIEKSPDKKDGRIVHLNITKNGRKVLLKTLPPQTLSTAWGDLPNPKQNQLMEGLQHLLQTMQELNGMRPFGLCSTCRFNNKKSEGKYFCELTQENLSQSDVKLICREHQQPEKKVT